MEKKNYTDPQFANLGKIAFSWYDYIIFSVMLIISALIGVYFGCFGKKQKSVDEYLLGGKTMKVFPIAMSLVASQISGITLLSVPADVYMFGVAFWFSCISVVLTGIITNYVYLPVLYTLQITSSYEYLNLRFDSRVRSLASFLFTLAVIIYMPIVIYVPSLALAQATDLNLHTITPIICGVCIFYTTIGGLKAVVWTDMLQFVVMVGAMVAVFCLGLVSVGGFGAVFRISKAGQRLDMDFDVDPTKRDTFWAVLIGWTIALTGATTAGQSAVQKLMAVPTLRDAKMAIIAFMAGLIVVHVGCLLIGLITYSKYYDCDPISTGVISRSDQLLPHFVMDVSRKIPGLPGLFIAGIFCAALSTLSTNLNAVAGTLYEDFISRYMPVDITQKRISNILKLIVIVLGVLSTGLVFIVQHLGGILPVMISFASVTFGPLFGLFTLGMLFPRANSKGAFYGGVAALLFVSWIVTGSLWYQLKGMKKYRPKPLSTDGCAFNVTTFIKTTTEEPQEIFFIYRITYYYHMFLGAIAVVVVGLIVSYFTKSDGKKVHRNLLSPVIYPFLKDDKFECGYDTEQESLRAISSNKENEEKVL